MNSGPQTLLGVDPAGDSSAIEELAASVRAFEQRLFHGILLARAVVPAAIFLVVASAANPGRTHIDSLVVWLVLALWTCSTTSRLWTRLEWLRRFPLPARLETAAFVGLIFLGIGTRPWHLLHSFVPLVFVAFFVRGRAIHIVSVGVVASMLAPYPVRHLWPNAPVETPMQPVVPVAIVLATSILLVYVRRVLDDTLGIVDARKRTMRDLARSQRRLLLAEEQSAVFLAIAKRVRTVTDSLRSTTFVPVGDDNEHLGELQACLAGIDSTLDEMESGYGSDRPASSLADVLDDAVARTDPMGGFVLIDQNMHAALGSVSAPPDAGGLRRLFVEALGNARRHGQGDVRVFSESLSPLRVVILNAAPRAANVRDGGLGLAAMEADASSSDATVDWSFRGGVVRTTIGLHASPAAVRDDGRDETNELREMVARRRDGYENGIAAARLLFSILTTVAIVVQPSVHRTLFPALVATAGFLVVWNGALFVRRRRVRAELARRPDLVWVDGMLMALLILFEGGMSSPWMSMAMVTLMSVTLWRGKQSAMLLVCLYAAALLLGYGAMRVLPVDDEGTAFQQMPLEWFLNVFIFAAVAAVSYAAAWAFDRAQDAADAYARVLVAHAETQRESARAEAHLVARRELHATLVQYVRAALLRSNLVERATGDRAAAAGLADRLSTLRDLVDGIVGELSPEPDPLLAAPA